MIVHDVEATLEYWQIWKYDNEIQFFLQECLLINCLKASEVTSEFSWSINTMDTILFKELKFCVYGVMDILKQAMHPYVYWVL